MMSTKKEDFAMHRGWIWSFCATHGTCSTMLLKQLAVVAAYFLLQRIVNVGRLAAAGSFDKSDIYIVEAPKCIFHMIHLSKINNHNSSVSSM
jgi:hypothetical protein